MRHNSFLELKSLVRRKILSKINIVKKKITIRSAMKKR